jgi:hypothetical protein
MHLTWYVANGDTLTISGLTGGATSPILFPCTFVVQGSTRVIINEGVKPPPSESRSPGPALTRWARTRSTGEKIGLQMEVDEGETNFIDIMYGNLFCWLQVSDGIQTNAMQYLSSDSTFWQLVPGENIVTFSTTSGSVEVANEYASRYTGV